MKLYTMDNCANCEAVKKMFDDNGIDYTVHPGEDFIANSKYLSEAAYLGINFQNMPIGVLDHGRSVEILDYYKLVEYANETSL